MQGRPELSNGDSVEIVIIGKVDDDDNGVENGLIVTDGAERERETTVEAFIVREN